MRHLEGTVPGAMWRNDWSVLMAFLLGPCWLPGSTLPEGRALPFTGEGLIHLFINQRLSYTWAVSMVVDV